MLVRPLLQPVLAALLADSEHDHLVTLDAVGEALGTLAITPEDIDALLAALEAAGRNIVGPEGGGGEARLLRVLAAARALRDEGTRPSVPAIAVRTGLREDEVRSALALARVMQR